MYEPREMKRERENKNDHHEIEPMYEPEENFYNILHWIAKAHSLKELMNKWENRKMNFRSFRPTILIRSGVIWEERKKNAKICKSIWHSEQINCNITKYSAQWNEIMKPKKQCVQDNEKMNWNRKLNKGDTAQPYCWL